MHLFSSSLAGFLCAMQVFYDLGRGFGSDCWLCERLTFLALTCGCVGGLMALSQEKTHMIERIVAGLLSAVLWLGVWLSPMLLTMAMACLLVWGWQGGGLSGEPHCHGPGPCRRPGVAPRMLAERAGAQAPRAAPLSRHVDEQQGAQPAPIPSSPLNAVTPASRRRHRSSVWLSRYLATGLSGASRAYQAASTAFL